MRNIANIEKKLKAIERSWRINVGGDSEENGDGSRHKKIEVEEGSYNWGKKPID